MYVKNLAPTVTDEDIIGAFSEFGEVKLPTIRNKWVWVWVATTTQPSCASPARLHPAPHSRVACVAATTSTAWVKFYEPEAAQRAAKGMNGKQLNGRVVSVEMAREKGARATKRGPPGGLAAPAPQAFKRPRLGTASGHGLLGAPPG